MPEDYQLLNEADFQTVLEKLAAESESKSEKGTSFEDLCVKVLRTAPIFTDVLKVWKWADFPGNGGYHDSGIDIVSLNSDNEYHAYQCKFYKGGEKITRDDVNKFIAQAQIPFVIDEKEHRYNSDLVVLTSVDEFSDNVAQLSRVVRLFGHDDFINCGIDWSTFNLDNIDEIKLAKKKVLLPHQVDAVKALIKGFVDDNDERGRLTMACGTGKTFTSLKFLEEYKNLTKRDSLKVLYLVPSIALLSQTIFEWNNNLNPEYKACNFGVCSDSTAGKEKGRKKTDDENIIKMPIRSTTNVDEIKKAYDKEMRSTGKKDMLFFFSTYQSISVVHDFQEKTGLIFDFVICDEAHRTIGAYKEDDDEKSDFVKVHDGDYIKSIKRLYMTATEKIYAEKAKNKAADHGYEVFSMDDESIYGKRLYLLTFGEAISRNLLMDYRVMVLTVDKKQLGSYKLGDANLEFTSKILGSLKGMSKIADQSDPDEFVADPRQMQRIVAFTSTIDQAKQAAKAYNSLKNKSVYGEEKLLKNDYVVPNADFVTGSDSSEYKNKKLKWLKSNEIKPHECRILTNARCLSEGVDVPALDGVVFLTQRKSQVDIIQAVGRVMRKFGAGEDKKFGYIIIPVVIDSESDASQILSSSADYKIVWQVIQALRSHDERLDNNINAAKLTGKLPANIVILHDFNIPGISSETGEGGGDTPPLQPVSGKVLIDLINAFIAELVKHCGDRLYWEDWSKNIGDVTTNISIKIKSQIENNQSTQMAFKNFMSGLRTIINPFITEETAINMLSSHIVVIPVLKSIFGTAELIDLNEISKIMNKMVTKIRGIEAETNNLKAFYEDVKRQVSTIKDGKGRQELIRTLFEKFFQYAMPKDAEKFGIVYTPIEIVDFIINSVNDALKDNFSKTIADKGIKILDPFTGTGTFVVRLLEKIFEISNDKSVVKEKYRDDIWCNEIMLLAYYIALINIEDTFSRLGDDYIPFNHALLTDTFQLSEGRVSGSEQGKIDIEEFNIATDLMREEDSQDIRIIIGNPPYSAGQKSFNDDNQNLKYRLLDGKIERTYCSNINSKTKKSLYDSYIRAFRWATDRIGTDGIISFVSNGSYIDSSVFSGFRRELLKEFNHIYVYNLRGDCRSSGEFRKKEAGNVFGEGSRTLICIIVLIKKQNDVFDKFIHYKDIGDYLTSEKKLEIIKETRTFKNISFNELYPDKNYNFLTTCNDNFEKFTLLSKFSIADKTFIGLSSARDSWIYNFSKSNLISINKSAAEFYNQCLSDNNLCLNTNKISRSRGLKNRFLSKKEIDISRVEIKKAIFRPFVKKYIFCCKEFIEMPSKWLYCRDGDIFLNISAKGSKAGFSALVTNLITDYHALYDTKTFPTNDLMEDNELNLYCDEKTKIKINSDLVKEFKNKYSDENINSENVFYYLYAVLNCKTYKEKYDGDLNKSEVRIPYLKDFWQYSNTGKKLADMHLNYENASPYREVNIINEDGIQDYSVRKIVFLAKDRKDTIIFNSHFKISNIPLKAYDYVVNGRSPVERVMDQYKYSVYKDSGIIDDPNKFDEKKGGKYIFDLLLSLMTVSLETLKLIEGLPKYEEI